MIRDKIKESIAALAKQSSRDELLWMSGYITGLAGTVPAEKSNGDTVQNGRVNGQNSVGTITLIYGTETGNAKRAATQVAAEFKQKGLRVKLSDAAQYDESKLSQEENLLVIISTQGDGEPPESARGFYNHLATVTDTLTHTKFAVLGLGSTAYPLFCQTGIDVDARLERAGAKRLLPLVKCDEDFDEELTHWTTALQQIFGENRHQPYSDTRELSATKPAKTKERQTANAVVTANVLLNDEGSTQQMHHIELRLEQRFDYRPGDAVGIVPHNSNALVSQLILLGGVPETAQVAFRSEEYSLRHLLSSVVNVQFLSLRYIQKYSTLTGHDIPATRMDLYDLLRIYPVKDSSQFLEAVALLDAIAPRLYTLSSSPAAHPNALHLTVLRLRVHHEDALETYGLCSNYLSQIPVGTSVSVFLHQHKHFQMPADGQNIIMIGNSSGIAPFRSFIAERDVLGHSGNNWLFFGDGNFVTDFYYQTEWQAWHDTGVLQQIDLAWAKGIEGCRYVQDSLLQKGKELWQWIDNGAQVFVSGDKEPMSREVESALLQIMQQHGKLSHDEAGNYLKTMIRDGRYAKDVY